MSEELFFTEEGSLGLITLNRPKALNALTLTMIKAMQKQLSAWKEDERIRAVVVQAVPGAAFCAGGDIRSLYFSGPSNHSEQMEFFWHEYRLNYFIHHFGKPYIALMDGLVMGGGVGISLHGSHPIACDNFVFAMPETSIGFFPDIGASYLLTRCPKYLGIYLGLTGDRLGPQEALTAGLVRQTMASEQIPSFLQRLNNSDWADDPFNCVAQCLQEYGLKPISLGSKEKEQCFAAPTIELIMSSLQQGPGEWYERTYKSLLQKSPLSLKVTLAQLQKANGLSLGECLQMDYGLVSHFMKGKDFYEGVRALLIDKDKNPHWDPECLELVTQEMVEDYFKEAETSLKWNIP